MNSEKKFTIGENGNRAIKASAGSGKTFSLAMRFISLLFLEVKPDPAAIVAITFTRKAAAEILDKIIEQLLYMEKNPSKISEFIAAGMLPPEFSRSAIAPLAARILNSPELQISTIDSFCIRIIQTFAPEFGLTGEVEIIDENRNRGEKETIAELIRLKQQELPLLLRDYAQGNDARNFTSTLKAFLKDNYEAYLLFPNAGLWGNLPDEEDNLTQPEQEQICDTLAGGMEHYNYPDGIRKRLDKIIFAATTGDYRQLERFPDCCTDENSWYFSYYKKRYPISLEMVNGIRRLFHHFAVSDLRKKIAKSRAAYQILRLYDTLYAANVRDDGKLLFRDLPKVLSELGEGEKLDIEFRMDTHNRHYMLDEFQDTSSQQWHFMENLISEAIQNPEQSFFMVGDIKQSLYQWRHGNPKLFDAICDENHYNIEVENSDTSYRSAQEVIDAVNRVFLDNLQQLPAEDQAAIKRMGFKKHLTEASADGIPLAGYASLTQIEESVEMRARTIVNRLKELDYPDCGISVAILFSTNKEIEKYKQELLRIKPPSWTISTEGTVQCAESMACSYLTLLLRLAAHPGDPMAVKALPLFSWENSAPFTAAEIAQALRLSSACDDWFKLSTELRMLLAESGIAGIISRFQTAYESRLSKFDCERLAVAAGQAEDFDGTVDEFLAILQKARQPSASMDKTIQLMTIHKSKGLEFDVVFLPELGPHKGNGGNKLEIDPREVSDPQWISYLPTQIMDSDLPEIKRIKDKISADQRYEKCCGLYVAMTRAKHELDMLIAPDVNAGAMFRADILLGNALPDAGPETGNGILYSHGNPQWQSTVKKKISSVQTLDQEKLFVKRSAVSEWSSPSREEAENADGAMPQQYRFDSSRAAGIGTRIHAMFESVAYWEDRDQTRLDAIAGNDEITPAVKELWQIATSPDGEIVKALSRPATPSELWREREFLMQDKEGKLISGCFDRVEITRDASGQPAHAVIYDYKSDLLDNPEDFLTRHRRQLNSYREVCAQMTGLPSEQVDCSILALRLCKIIPVPLE